MREATLWAGSGAMPGLRRAVLLPEGVEMMSDAEKAPLTTVPIGSVVYDPAPCVTRAGLVRHLAAKIHAPHA